VVPTNNIESLDDSTIDSSKINLQSSHIVSTSYPEPTDISGNTYTDHPRITITSNGELLSQKTTESWNGSGIESDPIEITGYNFTSTAGVLISISNTDLYFKIEGNFFFVPTDNYNGINLSNVTNANITNNYFDKTDVGVSFNGVNFTSIQTNHFTSFTGISITSGNNNSIVDNYFNPGDTAVLLYSVSTFYTTVYNNTFFGTAYGVYVMASYHNEISSNYFTQTSLYSIYVTQSGGFYSYLNLIRNNVIHDSAGPGVAGIFVSSYSHNNTISGNEIANVTLSIRLSYADNNTVFDNSISNTTQGISSESSQWNAIYRNNISDVIIDSFSANALFIYKTGNNTIYSNNVTDVDNAIYMYQSSQNTLYGNNMTGVSNMGVHLLTSSLNAIYDNEIVGGTTGLYLHSSSTNNTLNMNVLQFQDQGIQLQTTSHSNTFEGNRIENATNYGFDSTTSYYLTITNNTIINSGLRGINIDPTSYPVIAYNQIINNGQYGIYLDTGFKGKIYNNTVKYHSLAGAYVISTNQHNISFNIFANNSIGLSLPISDGGHVIGNVFSNNTDTGLSLDSTDGLFITDNTFENNDLKGLHLVASTVNIIANNTLFANKLHGIVVQAGSSMNFLHNNTIHDSLGYGIWLASDENSIRQNIISNSDVGVFIDTANINSIEINLIDNSTDGIRLYNADSNTILLNTISNNAQYGIYSESPFMETSSGNLIYNNTILSNGVYGVHLDATAQSVQVKWNDFITNTAHGTDSNPPAYGNIWDGNYFDDWDQLNYYYSLDFDTRDNNPAASPLNPSMVHFLLPAMILIPEASVMYTEDITITWNSGYDSDDHSLFYSLYYSNNTGTNWYFIVGDLTNSSYSWNASALFEGTNYQVRLITTDSVNNSVQVTSNTFSIDTNAPRLGVLPSNFTVELSFDPPPELSFSAYDSNPDYAYIEWMGFEMSDPTFWSNDTIEGLFFYDGSVQFGVGEHPLYLVVLDTAGHEARYLFYMTVEDTVNPTLVIEETNQIFELGPHDNVLSWTVYDLAAGTYDAYFNDSLDMSNPWVSNTGTELNVDSYMPGLYNVTVVFSDSSGNLVTRSINLTIIDTTSPSIGEFPDDDTIEFGATSNYLNWTLSELDPSVFNVIINSQFSEQLSYTNGTVLLDIDGLSLGYNNITVVFFDNSGNMVNDSVFITVFDTISPIIASQNDIVLEFGSVGNVVNWTATDLLPDNYTVYIEGSYWISGIWSNDSVVSVSIDGLSLGNHSFQIFFADSSNNQKIAGIVIGVQDTISPELISSPDDIQYNLGTTGHSISWIATDPDSGNYSIFIDDTHTATNTWTTSVPIVISVDGLSIGTHTVEIRFSDASGNMVSDNVTVTVIEVTTTTTTSTTTTTTTTGNPTGGGSIPILGIVGVGMSAIILVVLGILFIRKKAI